MLSDFMCSFSEQEMAGLTGADSEMVGQGVASPKLELITTKPTRSEFEFLKISLFVKPAKRSNPIGCMYKPRLATCRKRRLFFTDDKLDILRFNRSWILGKRSPKLEIG